jgi:DNA (cytosine-5)-methyltransferase 1
VTAIAYYNEFDKYAAQWLRNLIATGHIAPGDVDERSITEVHPDDLRGYTQCHFFAGIGGWSCALLLAGWPDDRPVWTGSCPCQPFSAAGAQRGSDDERHLWPAFFRLIGERRPAAVFGEQVAGAAGLAWLDHVCAGELADLQGGRCGQGCADASRRDEGAEPQGAGLGLADDRCGSVGNAGNAGNEGLEIERRFPGVSCGASRAGEGQTVERTDPLAAWSAIEWIACADGKARPTQPGLFPLAHGVPARVGRLRAYGNAIVPQVAAAFIAAASAAP